MSQPKEGAHEQLPRQEPSRPREQAPPAGQAPQSRSILVRWARLSLDLILDLFYPRPCAICGRRLGRSERCLCLECASRLPRYHEEHTSASERLLGSPLIRSLSALTIYHHDEDSHRLITSLKYSGYRELAPADLPGVRLLLDGRRATDPARWAGTPRLTIGGGE